MSFLRISKPAEKFAPTPRTVALSSVRAYASIRKLPSENLLTRVGICPVVERSLKIVKLIAKIVHLNAKL
jgi:hypothetical protein